MNISKKYKLALIFTTVSLLIIYSFLHKQRKLIVAPMIGGLNSCVFKKQELIRDTPNFQYTKLCIENEESPEKLIEATLNKFSNNSESNEKYKLGYTLYIPLLKLFSEKNSNFEIDKIAVNRLVKSIKNVDRPVILYLFSDHFSVDAPIEEYLAKNSDNFLKTTNGTLPIDKYYGSNIYPWSFVDTKNEISKLREIAFNAVLDETCKLPNYAIKRIAGVTVLGELHHMFPDFQSGMGFSGDYLISDYSQHSIEGFRDFLAGKYASITNLNKYLDSTYSGFKEVFPPSKNIRTSQLKSYFEHIDAYAHGSLPISGWVANTAAKTAEKNWIHIYLNGDFLAKTPVAFGRQDVLSVHSKLPSPDVGWQFNLDYKNLSPGIYNIDIFLAQENNKLTYISKREISVMDRSQSTPKKLDAKTLPTSTPPDAALLFHIDTPSNATSYYYNPLVVLWHDFRKKQVKDYLNHFGKIAKSKCINPELIYSHQILPFVNPGWDENKFSVGRDLAVPASMSLGVSLYGEASYGTSFFDWFRGTQRTAYGVTEFHPLKKMNTKELDFVLNKHYENNAQFLSFFAESVGLSEDPTNKPNIFSFDKNNKNAGSDVLFESMRELLK